MFYNNVSLSPKNTKYHTFSPSGTTQQKVVSFADYLLFIHIPACPAGLGIGSKTQLKC